MARSCLVSGTYYFNKQRRLHNPCQNPDQSDLYSAPGLIPPMPQPRRKNPTLQVWQGSCGQPRGEVPPWPGIPDTTASFEQQGFEFRVLGNGSVKEVYCMRQQSLPSFPKEACEVVVLGSFSAILANARVGGVVNGAAVVSVLSQWALIASFATFIVGTLISYSSVATVVSFRWLKCALVTLSRVARCTSSSVPAHLGSCERI